MTLDGAPVSSTGAERELCSVIGASPQYINMMFGPGTASVRRAGKTFVTDDDMFP